MFDKVILLLNCEKQNWKRLSQKEWLEFLPDNVTYFHVQGNAKIQENYYFNHEEKLLIVKCNDDYLSLCQKTFLMVQAVQEQMPEISHVIKTDDDQQMKTQALYKLLETIDGYDYGGHMCHMKEDAWSDYHFTKANVEKVRVLMKKTEYCNGRFYFLSRKAMKLLVEQKNNFFTKGYEDNIVGQSLSPFFNQLKILRFADYSLFYEDPVLVT